MDGTAEKERVQNEERAEDSFKGQEEKEEPSEEFEKESCAVIETKTKSFKSREYLLHQLLQRDQGR